METLRMCKAQKRGREQEAGSQNLISHCFRIKFQWKWKDGRRTKQFHCFGCLHFCNSPLGHHSELALLLAQKQGCLRNMWLCFGVFFVCLVTLDTVFLMGSFPHYAFCHYLHYSQCFICVKLYTPFQIWRFFTIIKIHTEQKKKKTVLLVA